MYYLIKTRKYSFFVLFLALDIKPSNILIDEQGNIKLCDFGISGILIESKAKSRNAGCAAYMSPERISPLSPEKPDYDIRADIWSLGISLVSKVLCKKILVTNIGKQSSIVFTSVKLCQ